MRRHPVDRRQQIVRAGARAFADLGYHHVSLSAIAAEVGITGPALHRHFPNKYALFVACADALAGHLYDAWPPPPPGADLTTPDAAATQLHSVFEALTETTIRHRREGGIYRWEGRYLQRADRAAIAARYQQLVDRIAHLVTVLRPELDRDQAQFVAVAALSVVGSITAHRTSLAPDRIAALISRAAVRVAGTAAATAPPAVPSVPTRIATGRSARADDIVAGAIRLFHQKGYAEASIEEIAGAAGLSKSGVYRHFATKSDVLMAACTLTAHRLDRAVEGAGIRGVRAEVALPRLVAAYVAHCVANHEQVSVYHTSIGSLAAPDRARLQALQRDHVALWTGLLRAADPVLEEREARFLALAAINVVTDTGRWLGWAQDDAALAAMQGAVLATLG